MKSALFVYGGWEGHEPKQCAELVGGWLKEQNWQVELSDSLDLFVDTEKLMSLNLIVPVWTMGELTAEQESGLVTAVQSGVGLAAWHGAAAAFNNALLYKLMLGGQFIWHPPVHVQIDVKITEPSDQIVLGIGDFTITSEQYYLHVDPSNHVLATTTLGPHTYDWLNRIEVPVLWKRTWGKGRVFYFAIGHTAAEFNIPQIKQITHQGLLWAAA